MKIVWLKRNSEIGTSRLHYHCVWLRKVRKRMKMNNREEKKKEEKLFG